MRKVILLLFVAVPTYLFWDQIWNFLKPAPPGSLRSEPLQKPTRRTPFQMGEYEICPLADYQLEARIFGRKHYDDQQSDIMPEDLAMGWGIFADEKNAAKITVTQEGRFSNVSVDGFFWNLEEAHRNFSNVHIISANQQIARFIEKLSPGDLVSMSGCLVAVRAKDGSKVESSLSRDDWDAGACEVFYVEHASNLKPGRDEPPSAPASTSAAKLPSRAPPPPVAVATPGGQKEVPLRFSLYVRLEHGSMTIPAREKIVLLEQRGPRTKARYRGMTFWVDTREIQ